MARPAKSECTWSDDQLKDAVAASTTWRDVMRALGLGVNSAGAIRIVRRHVLRLGLDTSHFRGKRIWSDAQLRRAVIGAQSWDELLATLGLAQDNWDGRTRVKAQAVRLGLNVVHLENRSANSRRPAEAKPDLKYLRDAAACIAASWFSLCGFTAAIPVEPAVYDLLVSMPDGIKRVQVKTTTYYSKDGWTVVVGRRPNGLALSRFSVIYATPPCVITPRSPVQGSRAVQEYLCLTRPCVSKARTLGRRPYSAGNRERLVPYDPELIDLFFIMDGDLAMYLIPSRVIAGRVAILLRTYTEYIVGNAAGLMAPRPHAA